MRVRHFCCWSVALTAMCIAPHAGAATACVWKVTAPNGKVGYFGGSVHALRPGDYPLPAAYQRAFDASSRFAFEVDAKALSESTKSLVSAGKYPQGDKLKNHVDPRTYAYVHRLFDLMNIPEESYARCRPWFIVLLLQSAGARHSLPEIGVDEYLMKRAAKRGLPIIGLENVEEHARVYAGLSDRESEILLLTTFIPSGDSHSGDMLMKLWRRGDADALAALMERESSDFPAFNERLIAARNRAWVPKIEKLIQENGTCFVVVGAGHFGGRDGLLALFRARGYQIEQL